MAFGGKFYIFGVVLIKFSTNTIYNNCYVFDVLKRTMLVQVVLFILGVKREQGNTYIGLLVGSAKCLK